MLFYLTHTQHNRCVCVKIGDAHRLTISPVASPILITEQTQIYCIYQLAFFTPGISPAEAISRNWILEMPN